GKIGQFMLRGTGRSSSRHGDRRGGSMVRGDGRLMAAWLAVGLSLLVIGYIGLLCGRMIKAAVSRQREFLADASAVQFTRSTDGLSGALWRIQEDSEGSLLASSYAEDMSHMCFGQSVVTSFARLMATHPPLDARLRALDPQFRARRVAARVKQANAPSTPGAPLPAGATGFAASEVAP
ncbi:MAG: M48 family metalloprotease, partial [Candidatus Omnitrophica bacterium]|nr:M48 family metalloprotease [Candidatus Omnitrophota bacterium]